MLCNKEILLNFNKYDKLKFIRMKDFNIIEILIVVSLSFYVIFVSLNIVVKNYC